MIIPATHGLMLLLATLLAALAAEPRAAVAAGKPSSLATAQGTPGGATGVSQSCVVGSYRLRDGTDVDIGASDATHLRWRRRDGTTGALAQAADGTFTGTLGFTGRPDGKRVSFSDCRAGEITFDGVAGRRIAFDVHETTFRGTGVDLAGRLVLPAGGGVVPIVVLVHGSERTSARDFYALQRLFPSDGVGVFVYDKRGTGGSGGTYTHDLLLLAEDAIAAVHEARRLAGPRAGRTGYLGMSQGGWVAPLAATLERVDFVEVAYGLAVSPLDEDREAIALDLTRRGFGAEAVGEAMEIADASAAIIRSGFREGYDRLDAVRARLASKPWFHWVHGNVTFALLATPPAEMREQGPALLAGVSLDYDPMPVLRNLATPQLWVLGEDDLDAPSAETARRLHALAADGHPVTTAVFPHAEHGLFEYETAPDGTRLSTRNPEGYFTMLRDFIRGGTLAGRYGASAVAGPGVTPPSR